MKQDKDETTRKKEGSFRGLGDPFGGSRQLVDAGGVDIVKIGELHSAILRNDA